MNGFDAPLDKRIVLEIYESILKEKEENHG